MTRNIKCLSKHKSPKLWIPTNVIFWKAYYLQLLSYKESNPIVFGWI